METHVVIFLKAIFLSATESYTKLMKIEKYIHQQKLEVINGQLNEDKYYEHELLKTQSQFESINRVLEPPIVFLEVINDENHKKFNQSRQ